MTTEEIANRLVILGRQGNWQQAQDALYHQDAESIEPDETPWGNVNGKIVKEQFFYTPPDQQQA